MSVLPTWDPNRLIERKPFNIALVGGRKQGKSTAQQDLIHRMSSEFDLVVCFIGSAACNPFLEHLLSTYWDPRFFFSEWDDRLIEALAAAGGATADRAEEEGADPGRRRDPYQQRGRAARPHVDAGPPLQRLADDVRRLLYQPPQAHEAVARRADGILSADARGYARANRGVLPRQ